MASKIPKKGSASNDVVEKMTTSMRLPIDLKNRIETAAAAAGRSLTQEIERRLEQSFRDEDLVPGVLSWAYGDELAGILLALGESIKLAGPLTRTSAEWTVAEGKVVQSIPNIAKWDESVHSRALAAKIAKLLVDILMKPGFRQIFEEAGIQQNFETYGNHPLVAVMTALGALRGDPAFSTDQWEKIRSLIGDASMDGSESNPKIERAS